MALVGYVRVSSVDQNEVRQLADLELNKIFTDKASGCSRNRPALADCLEWCREGDTLHVHSIDRLARDLVDLQNIVSELNAKGVSVRFEKENLVFSSDDSNPLNTLMLQMMGAFAQFERSMIKERQAEGIAAARKSGKKFGAPSKLNKEQARSIKLLLDGGHTKASIAASYKISRPTLNRYLKEMGA